MISLIPFYPLLGFMIGLMVDLDIPWLFIPSMIWFILWDSQSRMSDIIYIIFGGFIMLYENCKHKGFIHPLFGLIIGTIVSVFLYDF